MTQEQSNQNECQILIYSVQDFLARHSLLESGDYYKALLIISEYVETELSPPLKENKKTKKKHQPER